MADWSRRKLLRGMLGGGAVAVSLPMLDLFLDGNGQALANGAPMPVRFGTWFWGCGVNELRWVPDKLGAGYDLKPELEPIGPFQDKVTVLSGFNCLLGMKANLPHWSGVMATFTGSAPTEGGMGSGSTEEPTLDTIVADAIGKQPRFRSIEIACTGQPAVSYSMRAGSTVNPSEVDPVNLYQRLFGPGFADPNAASFTPDPETMLQQSVLSTVKDDRDELMRIAGAADRERIDQYFTSIRELEQQLAHQLEPPPPARACIVPEKPEETELGPTWEMAVKNHEQLARLAVMALACNQTRVFNIALSTAASNLRRSDSPISFHELTHEEPIDPKLGYQPESTFFMEQSMATFASLLEMMEGITEGDGTLLDNSLILATSESNFAKLHTLDSLPIMVAGKGGGRWKSGTHIAGDGDASSRVGLTIQHALGLPVSSWGTEAMETSRPIDEVLA